MIVPPTVPLPNTSLPGAALTIPAVDGRAPLDHDAPREGRFSGLPRGEGDAPDRRSFQFVFGERAAPPSSVPAEPVDLPAKKGAAKAGEITVDDPHAIEEGSAEPELAALAQTESALQSHEGARDPRVFSQAARAATEGAEFARSMPNEKDATVLQQAAPVTTVPQWIEGMQPGSIGKAGGPAEGTQSHGQMQITRGAGPVVAPVTAPVAGPMTAPVAGESALHPEPAVGGVMQTVLARALASDAPLGTTIAAPNRFAPGVIPANIAAPRHVTSLIATPESSAPVEMPINGPEIAGRFADLAGRGTAPMTGTAAVQPYAGVAPGGPQNGPSPAKMGQGPNSTGATTAMHSSASTTGQGTVAVSPVTGEQDGLSAPTRADAPTGVTMGDRLATVSSRGSEAGRGQSIPTGNAIHTVQPNAQRSAAPSNPVAAPGESAPVSRQTTTPEIAPRPLVQPVDLSKTGIATTAQLNGADPSARAQPGQPMAGYQPGHTGGIVQSALLTGNAPRAELPTLNAAPGAVGGTAQADPTPTWSKQSTPAAMTAAGNTSTPAQQVPGTGGGIAAPQAGAAPALPPVDAPNASYRDAPSPTLPQTQPASPTAAPSPFALQPGGAMPGAAPPGLGLPGGAIPGTSAMDDPRAVRDAASGLDLAVPGEPRAAPGVVDTRAANAPGTPPGQAAQTARQVAIQISEAVLRGADRPIDLTLNPAELGRVRISLSAVDGSMMVSVLAERPETLELMRRNIDMLAQEFRDIGYEGTGFSFAQGAGDGPGGDTASGEHAGSSHPGQRPAASSESPITQMAGPPTGPTDRLDIRL